jgi:hypothetical protein
LYEFIDGRKLRPDETGQEAIEKAAAFFRALNGPEKHRLARSLPAAAEACFNVAEHLALIDRRLSRLSAIPETDDASRAAAALCNRLRSHWGTFREHIATAAATREIGLTEILTMEQRCVSPSDFGFHNALLRANGDLCFIDFEYAGWDDPAKMAADFFCQPHLPVDTSYFEFFCERTMGFTCGAEALMERARVLMPAFRVKWSCIMLNDFLPDLAQRRRFANPDTDIGANQLAQLAKVEYALHALEG